MVQKGLRLKKKSSSSGRSCRPQKITADYNYMLISEILLGSRQVMNKQNEELKLIDFTVMKNMVLQPTVFYKKLSKVLWVFFFTDLLFNLSSYFCGIRQENVCFQSHLE